MGAYPFGVAMLLAPSALTAGPYILAKGTKTACSCIRPYASLRVPSLLKSQFAVSELALMKIKINTLKWDFPAMRCNWQVDIAGQARSHRETS